MLFKELLVTEFFNVSKHFVLVHMVPVNDGVEVREVRLVAVVDEDGSAGLWLTLCVVAEVHVIRLGRVEQRVVNVGVVNGDPSDNVWIQFLKVFECFGIIRKFRFVHDELGWVCVFIDRVNVHFHVTGNDKQCDHQSDE